MKNPSRKFTSKFKTKIVLEVIKDDAKIGEVAERYELHRNQVSNWKKEFLEKAHLTFELNDIKLMELESKKS